MTRSVQLSRAYGQVFFLALSESHLAIVAQEQGADDALALAQAGVAHWQANGHPRGTTTGLWALSGVLLAHGELAHAEQVASQGLHLSQAVGDSWAAGRALLQLGTIALARADTIAARALVEESIAIFTAHADPAQRGRAMITLGTLALREGQFDAARRCFQEALDLGRTLEFDSVVRSAQDQLDALAQLI